MDKTSTAVKFIIPGGYILTFIAASMYIFVSNDEAKPLRFIVQPDYLIPIVLYAGGAVLFSYGIFRIAGKLINRFLAFFLSVIIGVPLGLLFIIKFVVLIVWLSER